MAWRYYVKKRHVKLSGLDEDRYCATLRAQNKRNNKEIAKELANSMSIEPEEAELMIGELARQISRAVLGGQSVKVEGLGVFTPAITVKQVSKADKVDAYCIKKAKVNFRMDTALKHQIEQAEMLYDKNIEKKRVS